MEALERLLEDSVVARRLLWLHKYLSGRRFVCLDKGPVFYL